MRLVYHVISAPSPLGLLFAAMTEKGLRYLQFMDRRSLRRTRAALEPANPEAVWEHSVRELEPVARQLDEYFNGERRTFSLPLDPLGSEFQHEVWRELRKIPFGETRSYGEVATALGQPRAARAVGLANNQNPVPIVVPCHRVIGADGKLVGYGGGVARKKYLIELEARYAKLAPTDGESVIASLHVRVPRSASGSARRSARRRPAAAKALPVPARGPRPAVIVVAPAKKLADRPAATARTKRASVHEQAPGGAKALARRAAASKPASRKPSPTNTASKKRAIGPAPSRRGR